MVEPGALVPPLMPPMIAYVLHKAFIETHQTLSIVSQSGKPMDWSIRPVRMGKTLG
jgi:hypothetical protein